MHIISFVPVSDLQNCYSVSRSWHTLLLANLPARLRPLPDAPTRSISTPPAHDPLLPLPTRNIARQIQRYTKQNVVGSLLLNPSDDYLFWLEAAYAGLLHALRPHLHPLLAQHAYDLAGGIDDVAKGDMGVWVRTRMRPSEFEALFDAQQDEEQQDEEEWGEPSCVVWVESQVFCAGKKRHCCVLVLSLFFGVVRGQGFGVGVIGGASRMSRAREGLFEVSSVHRLVRGLFHVVRITRFCCSEFLVIRRWRWGCLQWLG